MKFIETELLILSNGSEISGVALAEAASNAAIPFAVFSLVERSLLRDAPGCTSFVDLSSDRASWPKLRSAFLKALQCLCLSAGTRLVILPTDDGSLRLLNECRDDVLNAAEFPRARALPMGGMDKAEVVEYAELYGVSDGLVSSIVLDEPSEGMLAMEKFGEDAIFKPSLKPLDMDLSSMGARGIKVVTQRDEREKATTVIERLRKAWPMSSRWIAQPRLRTGRGVERSVCAVRGESVQACQVVEQAKYPRMGGTAYWVAVEQRDDLVPVATRLLEALDVVGVCELSFLPDAKGNGKLIELNPRPWLQIGLLEHAGFPMVAQAVKALRGEHLIKSQVAVRSLNWIQLERLILAFLGRECSVGEFANMVALALSSSATIGGFGSSLPRVKPRLILRALRKMMPT